MKSEYSSCRQVLVKQREKQERVDQFLGFYLDRLFADWDERPEERQITVIARSPKSPVVRALIANSEDLISGGAHIRIVFAILEPAEALTDWLSLCTCKSNAFVTEVRWAQNSALQDAHEQLVLGTTMSWCGDAMRRDPDGRDALEFYNPDCKQSATRGQRGFEALWRICKKVPVRWSRSIAGDAAGQAAIADAISSASVHSFGPTINTRH